MIPLSKRFKQLLRHAKPLAKDAIPISEEAGLWAVSLRGDLLERYYSDLYGGLLRSGQLLKMFPQLCGTYETDKLEWRRLVDNRDYFAEKMRDNKFKNNTIK